MTTTKKENAWNQLLFEKSHAQKYTNKQILILGRKGAGKRTLIDSLTDMSRTIYPKQNQLAGKLRVKGVSPLLDYTYLNVLDLNDPDFATNARLNITLLEEESHKYLLKNILNHNNIRNTFIVIALDMQEPWTFMEDLDRWISVIQDLMGELKLSLAELEDMKKDSKAFSINMQVELYIREFNQMDDLKTPLREGVLNTNIGVPIMVVVNKSDILESDDKGKDWDSKAEIMQYSLRNFCVNYGATLLFTSAKSAVNLEIFYHYILHRLYKMPLKEKNDLTNLESLFIPTGVDDTSIIKSIYNKIASNDIKYEEQIPQLLGKKQIQREELIVEDDQEFFAKLKEKTASSQPQKPSLPIQLMKQEQIEPTNNGSLSSRGGMNQELNEFYSKILNPTGKSDPQSKDRTATLQAQSQLHERLRQTKAETIGPATFKPNSLFNAQDQQKLSKIIPNVQQDSNRGNDMNPLLKIKNIVNPNNKDK